MRFGKRLHCTKVSMYTSSADTARRAVVYMYGYSECVWNVRFLFVPGGRRGEEVHAERGVNWGQGGA